MLRGKQTADLYIELHVSFVGSAVASWLVRSSLDPVVRVWALARDIVLCSWTRHFFSGLLIFRAVAEPRIWSKSTESREIHKNTGNQAKFAGNLTKHMSASESYLGSCFLALNLLIYLETSSPQVVNIPKLPGVLRLVLQKTGKQRCKNRGVPSVDWGSFAVGDHLRRCTSVASLQ